MGLENQQLSPGEQRDLTQRVRLGGYIPALPTEANDRIFRAITPEVHLLPARVIDPVVIYYRLLAIMSSLAGDLRLMAVKSPAESKKPWDYYKEVQVIPGSQAFASKAESKCKNWVGG